MFGRKLERSNVMRRAQQGATLQKDELKLLGKIAKNPNAIEYQSLHSIVRHGTSIESEIVIMKNGSEGIRAHFAMNSNTQEIQKMAAVDKSSLVRDALNRNEHLYESVLKIRREKEENLGKRGFIATHQKALMGTGIGILMLGVLGMAGRAPVEITDAELGAAITLMVVSLAKEKRK